MADIDDSDDDDFHKDRDELSYGELLNDLRTSQNKNLKWLLEEFEIQFDVEMTETKKDETRPIALIKRMIPYFLRLVSDENTSIQKFAKFGLAQIEKRFPDLYREIIEEIK